MKRVLIAGGAGFIGSHLCASLCQSNHEVFCLDNLYTGSKENIRELLSSPYFHFIYADVTKPLNFYTKVDHIINLACPASPIHYQRDPVHTLKTNIIGTLQLLEMAKQSSATLLQASTSEVYGDPQVHPQTESYWGNVNPIGPRACYDEGKRCAETLCVDFAKQEGVESQIIRIFNTYGTKMAVDDGRVVSTFIIQALQGKPITVYGEGRQTRSFQHVSDLIAGIRMVLDKNIAGPMNIGNTCEFTVCELAELVIEMIGSHSKIVYEPLPQDDPKMRKPDIQLAESYGWTPKIKLRDGLVDTISYFKTQLLKRGEL